MQRETDAFSSYVRGTTGESIFRFPSSFEELGIEDKFNFTKIADGVCFTDLIGLPGVNIKSGKLAVCALKVPIVEGDVKYSDYYSMILFSCNKQGITAVGHADFETHHESPKSCTISVSLLSLQDYQMRIKHVEPPDYFKLAVNGFKGNHEGMKLVRNQTGKGLGGLLWAMGCGFMEMQGCKVIRILNDLTAKRRGRKGFYRRYGTVGGEFKRTAYALTHLSAEQQILMIKAFYAGALKGQK